MCMQRLNHYTANYDANIEISKTHLGKAQTQRSDICRAQNYFKIDNQSRAEDNSVDGTECNILWGHWIFQKAKNVEMVSGMKDVA